MRSRCDFRPLELTRRGAESSSGGNRRKSESLGGIPPEFSFARPSPSRRASCFVLALSAGFLAARALLASGALPAGARWSRSLSRRHKRAWKSLKGDRPTGPTHGRLLLLRLSPWTFACARPPDAWRLPLRLSLWCVVLGVSSSGVRRALPTGAWRHVVPLAV